MNNPQHWRQHAACRGASPAAFYPEPGQWNVAAAAIAVCQTCPVVKQCGEVGAGEVYGIWGGVNAGLRRRGNRASVAA